MCFFYNHLTFGFLGVFFFTLTHCLYGQSKFQNPAIEHNWSHTYLVSASKNGEWVHYNNYYSQGSNNAFVKNINTDEMLEIPNVKWGEFSANSKYFAMRLDSNSLILINLESKFSDTIPNLKVNHFSHYGDYLITQSIEDSLTVTALSSMKDYKQGRCEVWEINPLKNIVGLAIKNNDGEFLQILNLESQEKFVVIGGENTTFQRLAWSANGQHLVFLYSNDKGKNLNLGMFDIKNRTSKFLDSDKLLDHDVSVANAKLSISDRGDRIFFSVRLKAKDIQSTSDPEIWDTFDTVLYPRKNRYNSGKNGLWTRLWLTEQDRLVSLANKEFPQVLFNVNSNYALNFDALAKEPQFRLNTFVDIYVLDMTTGKKELSIANQYTGSNFVNFSPQAKYVAYFKDDNWWLYDINQQKHSNLTVDLPHTVTNKKAMSLNATGPYGMAGWTVGDRELLIYDEYDVWKINSITLHKEKLTEGRASNTTYRIVEVGNEQRTTYDDFGFNTYTIDVKDGLLLSAKNSKTHQEGFYQWDGISDIRKITSKNKRLTNLIQLDKDRFLFNQQGFAEPVSVEFVNLKKQSKKNIYKSNPEWGMYKWPRMNLIEYDTEIADSLKAVLIYPLNYEANKKYPMIVHVYAEQSSMYNRFAPPSLYDDVGFNFMNYALDGYFVLFPDIKYKENAPGISATICVEKAVQTTLKTVTTIDYKKIGLIGHSFGGYETAFLISQTDIFAAAVVGSGIFNLVSFYFDVYKTGGQSEMTRVEHNIFKMQNSFFQDQETYIANSPLHQAAKINTPILLWTGKKDNNVNPNQSLQGYLALRRLRKPAKLLYYEEEGHTLHKQENKIDLSERIKKWFDSYLK